MRHLSVSVILGALAITACDAGKRQVNQADNSQRMEESRTTTTPGGMPAESNIQSEDAASAVGGGSESTIQAENSSSTKGVGVRADIQREETQEDSAAVSGAAAIDNDQQSEEALEDRQSEEAVVAPQGEPIEHEREPKSTSTSVVPVPVDESDIDQNAQRAQDNSGIVDGNDVVQDPEQDSINAMDSDEMQAQEAYDEELMNEQEMQEQEEVYSDDDVQLQEVVPQNEQRKTYNELQISDDVDDYPLTPDNGGDTYDQHLRN